VSRGGKLHHHSIAPSTVVIAHWLLRRRRSLQQISSRSSSVIKTIMTICWSRHTRRCVELNRDRQAEIQKMFELISNLRKHTVESCLQVH